MQWKAGQDNVKIEPQKQHPQKSIWPQIEITWTRICDSG